MMSENNDFMIGLLRNIQGEIGQVKSGLDRLEGRMEDRLANIERRLSSQNQIEQSLVGHLASIHSSIDNLRADFVGVERRVKALETR